MTIIVATIRETNPATRAQVEGTARKFGAVTFHADNVPEIRTLIEGTDIAPSFQYVPLELSTRPTPLSEFDHPQHAVYVLGPNTGTLTEFDLSLLRERPVYVETAGTEHGPVLSTPVLTGIVLHDRLVRGVA